MRSSRSSSKELQRRLEEIKGVRNYIWDSSPYEPVEKWEQATLKAIRIAFGRNSNESKKVAAIMKDKSWKDTNKPIALPPEVFVNNDFKERMDDIETLLTAFVSKLKRRTNAGTKKRGKKLKGRSMKRKTKKKRGRKKT